MLRCGGVCISCGVCVKCVLDGVYVGVVCEGWVPAGWKCSECCTQALISGTLGAAIGGRLPSQLFTSTPQTRYLNFQGLLDGETDLAAAASAPAPSLVELKEYGTKLKAAVAGEEQRVEHEVCGEYVWGCQAGGRGRRLCVGKQHVEQDARRSRLATIHAHTQTCACLIAPPHRRAFRRAAVPPQVRVSRMFSAAEEEHSAARRLRGMVAASRDHHHHGAAGAPTAATLSSPLAQRRSLPCASLPEPGGPSAVGGSGRESPLNGVGIGSKGSPSPLRRPLGGPAAAAAALPDAPVPLSPSHKGGMGTGGWAQGSAFNGSSTGDRGGGGASPGPGTSAGMAAVMAAPLGLPRGRPPASPSSAKGSPAKLMPLRTVVSAGSPGSWGAGSSGRLPVGAHAAPRCASRMGSLTSALSAAAAGDARCGQQQLPAQQQPAPLAHSRPCSSGSSGPLSPAPSSPARGAAPAESSTRHALRSPHVVGRGGGGGGGTNARHERPVTPRAGRSLADALEVEVDAALQGGVAAILAKHNYRPGSASAVGNASNRAGSMRALQTQPGAR